MTTKHNPNRLAKEKSPYLLQHAYNPVDWYPWSDEAFEKAQRENKPIFLSIGYSTCHWCHVMERESFEDEEVSRLLNNHFVAIKVDREERPDIDHIYMTVCQAMTGQGGWPLTIIMTPEQKPFLAGTYFPKRARWGRKGMIEILEEVRDRWQDSRDKIMNTGISITEYLQSLGNQEEKELGWDTLEEAFKQHLSSFDPHYGGFGDAPKFPTPHHLTFLLRYGKERKNKKALEMVTRTLDAMANGGIYDHIGFGFARYSVDEMWLVPHFEKMLYDNALLAYAYLEAYQVTGEKRYAGIVREIFTYVERTMTSPEGGFYSAEDADSEGIEGKFYIWTPEEIMEVLGEVEGEWFCKYYNVTPQGNFEGMNIINRIHPNITDVRYRPYVDEKTGIEIDPVKLAELRNKLYLAREKRVHPHKDDKILTGWNGLMIVALAKAAKVLQEPKYAYKAERNLDFLHKHLLREDGRLLARYRDGEAAFLGYLDDYAYLTWGLLELYEATFKTEYLEEAIHFSEEMIRLFWDEEHGGLFFTGNDAERLIIRSKEIYDGATPSGNSVAALNLVRLAKITARNDFLDKGEAILRHFSVQVAQYPFAYTQLLHALLFMLQETKEILFTGPRGADGIPEIGKMLQQVYLPEAVLIYHDENESTRMEQIAPYIGYQKSIDGKPTLYICQNYACRKPTTDYQEAIKSLKQNCIPFY